jgi:hypothetical protein
MYRREFMTLASLHRRWIPQSPPYSQQFKGRQPIIVVSAGRRPARRDRLRLVRHPSA